MAGGLTLDLEELRQLRAVSKRPRIVSLISSEIDRFEFLLIKRSRTVVERHLSEYSLDDGIANAAMLICLSTEAAAPNAQTPALIATSKVASATPGINYTTLGSFSWDQDNDKVTIYISLEGVDHEKIEADFKSMAVDIKIHDVKGKNYRCAIPKLNKEIVPEKCKVLVKPTRIVVTMVKASKGNWLHLHFKEDNLKPGLDKDKDPMAGIMDLMKNMYEEGDDEMKRTIAKVWTDARSGKTADSLKGYH